MTAQENAVLTRNPNINRIFFENDFNKAGHEVNVLVVETSINPDGDDDRLDELLLELNEIQVLAEKNIGSFERIDIRFR